MSGERIDGYDPTRIYDNRPECTHWEPVAKKTAPPPPPPPQNLPEASFGPLPRPGRVDAARVRTIAPDSLPARSEVQVRLDAFRERATPELMVDGKMVRTHIPFRITSDRSLVNDPRNAENPWVLQERIVERNRGQLNAAATGAGLTGDDVDRLLEGRATPEQIRAVTQRLIEAGRLPDPSEDAPDLPMRIRKMMYDHGIGLDCASYSQQAYLASRGLDRRATGLDPHIENENLSHLTAKGFRRVALEDARAGDLFILRPPRPREVGHTMIVYEHRDATEEELAALRREPGFGSGRVTVFVVDSSFGSNAEFDHGGVMRQVWFHDAETKTWARHMVETDPDGRQQESRLEIAPPDPRKGEQVYGTAPYFHSIEGVYRPRGEK